MIKINDKNINDILKSKDSIEKYYDLMTLLYRVFIKINLLEDSLETMVNFIEAITLFLRLNSRSLFNDDEVSDLLITRYISNKALANDGNALKVEVLEDEERDNIRKYISKNYHSMKKELYLYAKELYCGECCFDDFDVYMSNLIKKGIQALDSYEGNEPLTNSKLFGLYFYCKNMSITGVFRSSELSIFFDEEDCKKQMIGRTMEIPKPKSKAK